MAERSPEGINEALVLLEQELSVANEKYTPSPGGQAWLGPPAFCFWAVHIWPCLVSVVPNAACPGLHPCG
jgi:hypothetical protein